MSAFRDIMSIVGPGASKPAASRPQPAAAPKPAPRPAGVANGAAPAPQLKRKASGPVEGVQVKMQRKDSPNQPAPPNGSARPAAPGAARPNASATPAASTTNVPYRGTAAPASTRPIAPVKRAVPASSTVASSRPAPPAPKPASTGTSAAAPASKPKGYLALLQKAKEKESTRPVAPPVKNEVPKILTKKERMALKAESSAGAKGKKQPPGAPAKGPAAVKVDPAKDKKKAVDLGYQGTARPAKKAPEPLGYRGTARPGSAPVSSSRTGTPAAKPKPKPAKGRWDGYADWSDLDDMEDDEEDAYESDASSDMEGGMWDVEQEEQLALKAARKEDAEALAEEMRLKREKEEKKKKLAALSKAAAAKKKY